MRTVDDLAVLGVRHRDVEVATREDGWLGNGDVIVIPGRTFHKPRITSGGDRFNDDITEFPQCRTTLLGIDWYIVERSTAESLGKTPCSRCYR